MENEERPSGHISINVYFKGFSVVECLIAAICMLIPLFLFLADSKNLRASISNYAYMQDSYIFGMLLTMAAMLFLMNGALYLQVRNIKQQKRHGRWYNMVLGGALFGVVLFPHQEHVFVHYLFALLFFIGSAIVIALFHEPKHRKPSILIALLSLSGLAVYASNTWFIPIPFTGWVTLLLAEWLSLFVIGVHYILEASGKLT